MDRLTERTEILTEKIRELSEREKPEGDVTVIAIEGRCASGKTTLSNRLAERLGCGVIHMDDFFLPPELRTGERFAQAGGNIHYERFAEEVLPKLTKRESFSYRRFDCKSMRYEEERTIPEGEIRIVEGAYSCHPRFGDYMTLRAFCDVEYKEQLERIENRGGRQAVSVFRERWIPMEEKYFEAFSIKERADLVI